MIFPSLDFMLLELWYWDCLVHNCLPLPGTCLAYSRSSLMFIKLRWFLSLGWFYAIFLYPKAKTENANTVSFVLYECVCVCVCVVFCSHLCFSVYILVPNSFFFPMFTHCHFSRFYELTASKDIGLCQGASTWNILSYYFHPYLVSKAHPYKRKRIVH